jgi:UDP-2,3-diacylglucosamine pyrophosphatase LpxH
MLSIISDIHLSDGSTSFNVNGDAFKNIFKLNVMNSVPPDKSNGIREKSGKAKEVKIILLGDIFDFVRTDYWLSEMQPENRPWNGKIDIKNGMNNNSELMKVHYTNVLDRIFEAKDKSASDFLDTLIYLKEEIKVKRNIPFTVYYVIGNHDRILNNFSELKDKIRKRLKFDDEDIRFTNSFKDIEDYSTVCLHGHEFDEHNYGDKLYSALNKENFDESNKLDEKYYKVQSIGEAVTCELMSGLIYRLKNKVQGKFLAAVKDINNVRPMLNVFSWLSWFGEQGVGSEKDQAELLKAFRDSLKDLVETSLAKEWDKVKYDFLLHGDLVYFLKWGLSAIDGIDFDEASWLVKVYRVFHTMKSRFKNLLNPLEEDEYQKAALKLFENSEYSEAQYVLMGHTHEAMHVYFKGEINDKVNMYINTGTYLPFISRWGSSVNPFFVNSNQMTLINIYRRDEDLIDNENGMKRDNLYPTLVLWNGIKRKKYH